ncbi:MAG: MBL fold metallo-hydrolase [Sedimentisphaerales bacterium]|nr:MBL fold metallo-hydrolase [Sedimentisphaerales bacterium]
MKIDRFILGDFETNCYVVRADEAAKDCLVIDPGFDAQQVVDFLVERELNPVAIVLTHGHADHIVGVQGLRRQFPEAKVYIHKLDATMLTNSATNLSSLVGRPYAADPADMLLEDGETVEQAGVRLEVLHTPGHTPGGMSLYAREEGLAFVGDTLFVDSVGRTDFPGGDMGQLIRGIKGKLLTLPDNTVVYPGHGMRSTIGREKRANPFLI